jgi:hypothetical protein
MCGRCVHETGARTDWYYLAYDLRPSTTSFEDGNELWGCIKVREYLDQLSDF